MPRPLPGLLPLLLLLALPWQSANVAAQSLSPIDSFSPSGSPSLSLSPAPSS